MAGAVAGDHASPISDTTILSSMACECQILQHVRTQAPYAIMVATWSVVVGTIPSGWGVANWVCGLLGFIMMLFHVVFTSEFTINKTGRYDIFTELYLRCTKDKEFLLKLKEDTVIAFETSEPVPLLDTSKLIEEDDAPAAGGAMYRSGFTVDSGPPGPIKVQTGTSSLDKSDVTKPADDSGTSRTLAVPITAVKEDVENQEQANQEQAVTDDE